MGICALGSRPSPRFCRRCRRTGPWFRRLWGNWKGKCCHWWSKFFFCSEKSRFTPRRWWGVAQPSRGHLSRGSRRFWDPTFPACRCWLPKSRGPRFSRFRPLGVSWDHRWKSSSCILASVPSTAKNFVSGHKRFVMSWFFAWKFDTCTPCIFNQHWRQNLGLWSILIFQNSLNFSISGNNRP